MGHYTKAYAGVLAFACTGSLVVAVHAHDKAATLGAFDARADRGEAWARNLGLGTRYEAHARNARVSEGWCAQQDSNLRPLASEANALSS